ncbi:MAG: hypothetical protein R3B46_12525 [Phycisphaerales bacterium]
MLERHRLQIACGENRVAHRVADFEPGAIGRGLSRVIGAGDGRDLGYAGEQNA